MIVYYDGYLDLVRLLESIKKNISGITFEIIVVNNKTSGNIEGLVNRKFKEIRVINSQGNVGYGGGNNLGAKYAKGKYLFIANPDTVLKGNVIRELVNFLENNNDVAIVGPNFLYPGGKYIEQNGSRTLTPLRAVFALSIVNKIWANNPISNYYYLRDLPINKLREVDVVSGSAFLVRRSVFEEVGGFDANFFLFFEESDLCKRIKEKDWKIYINPKARVIHYWRPAEGGKSLNKYYKESRFYYFKKHYGTFRAILVEFSTGVSKRGIIFFLTVIACAMIFKYF